MTSMRLLGAGLVTGIMVAVAAVPAHGTPRADERRGETIGTPTATRARCVVLTSGAEPAPFHTDALLEHRRSSAPTHFYAGRLRLLETMRIYGTYRTRYGWLDPDLPGRGVRLIRATC